MKKILFVVAFVALLGAPRAQFWGPMPFYNRIAADTLADTSLIILQIPPYSVGGSVHGRSMTVQEFAGYVGDKSGVISAIVSDSVTSFGRSGSQSASFDTLIVGGEFNVNNKFTVDATTGFALAVDLFAWDFRAGNRGSGLEVMKVDPATSLVTIGSSNQSAGVEFLGTDNTSNRVILTYNGSVGDIGSLVLAFPDATGSPSYTIDMTLIVE